MIFFAVHPCREKLCPSYKENCWQALIKNIAFFVEFSSMYDQMFLSLIEKDEIIIEQRFLFIHINGKQLFNDIIWFRNIYLRVITYLSFEMSFELPMR